MSDITISSETIDRIWVALRLLADIGVIMAITSIITAIVVRDHYKQT
ncbi:hypothetical protein GYB59_24775 [bacterium]|nr:hypothetical protein [bacterium]